MPTANKSQRTMNTITLNNGVKMPQLGLGTYLIDNNDLDRVIGEAFSLGYRSFDTAWKYHNERAIAQALKANGIKREEVFITTKINIDSLYYRPYVLGKRGIYKNFRNFKSIKDVIQESFDNLQTDYVDLFLVHYPYKNLLKMYEVLCDFYESGRIRAIGVSSFLPPHIEALKQVSDIVPAVNQFEISPLNTQKQLIEYCKARNIAVEAMSTFSHFRSNLPRYELIENDDMRPIAEKYGKSIVQIVLRWLIQQGIIVIPKTWVSHFLKENINVFDFSLNDQEMSFIDSLDTGKFLNYNPYHMIKYLPRKYRNWKGF